MDMHDLHVGQEIYVVSYGDEDVARKVSIERETKTQWILSNGDRYRKSDLTEIGESKRSVWSRRFHMEPLDTEYGRKIATMKAISLARTRLQKSINDWEKDRSNIDMLQEIRKNAEQMIAVIKGATEGIKDK